MAIVGGSQKTIAKHVAAQEAYASAVAWTIAAEAQNLPLANIEQAHLNSFKLDQEMQEAARSLVICMPTSPRALVDLLLYLEKHFTTLPQEVNGRSLAFDLLRTMRLSLRADARRTLKWEDAHFRAGQSWFSRHRLAASELWLRTIVPNPSLAPLVRQPHHL